MAVLVSITVSAQDEREERGERETERKTKSEKEKGGRRADQEKRREDEGGGVRRKKRENKMVSLNFFRSNSDYRSEVLVFGSFAPPSRGEQSPAMAGVGSTTH